MFFIKSPYSINVTAYPCNKWRQMHAYTHKHYSYRYILNPDTTFVGILLTNAIPVICLYKFMYEYVAV